MTTFSYLDGLFLLTPEIAMWVQWTPVQHSTAVVDLAALTLNA